MALKNYSKKGLGWLKINNRVDKIAKERNVSDKVARNIFQSGVNYGLQMKYTSGTQRIVVTGNKRTGIKTQPQTRGGAKIISTTKDNITSNRIVGGRWVNTR